MMQKIIKIFNFTYADFLERIRRYSFLIIVGLTVFMGALFSPADGPGPCLMSFGDCRGRYNSEFIGCGFALVTSMALSLLGFYLVKYTIKRDNKIGAGQIAASSVTKFQYCLGKSLSNFALLFTVSLIMLIDAVIVQLIRGEDLNIKIPRLVLPFLYSTLPTIIVVAVLAVIFENIKWLRNKVGNIIYFLIWIYFVHEMCYMHGKVLNKPYLDLFGGSFIIHSIFNDLDVFNGLGIYHEIYFNLLGVSTPLEFPLRGINWGLNLFLYRYLWVIAAILILFIASICIDRFSKSSKNNKKCFNIEKNVEDETKEQDISTENIKNSYDKPEAPHLELCFTKLVLNEMKLAFFGRNYVWYIFLCVLFCLTIFAQEPYMGTYLPLTLIYLLTITVWSNIGIRKYKNKTKLMIFSNAHHELSQFFASYLSAVIIFFIVSSGAIIAFIIHGNWINIVSICILALFIPALALFFGALTKGPRTFEIIYLIIWYLGQVQSIHLEYYNYSVCIPKLTFINACPFNFLRNISLYYISCIPEAILIYIFLTILFLCLAFIGRRFKRGSE